MIALPDGISYNGARSNFERDSFDTIESMMAYTNTHAIDDGHISYCRSNQTHYKYNAFSAGNPETGKWEVMIDRINISEIDNLFNIKKQ